MQDYVSPDNWKTLNALEGFGIHQIATTGALSDRVFDVQFQTGESARFAFIDAERMRWQDSALGSAEDQPYEAREVVPDVFLVMAHDVARPDRALTLLLDGERAIVTLIVSTVVGDDAAGRRVEEEIRHGFLGADNGDCHPRTDEMVGHRFQYVYSPTEAYEHIYLNAATYAWHCLDGVERGEADCDPMISFKVRDQVYLAAWREGVVPCDGIVVLDWVRMRSNGRIFGWDDDAREFNSITMGARAIPLNHTTYAPLED